MSILRTTNRMSKGFGFDLQMLTILFIGLLILAVGLYINKHSKEGFQDTIQATAEGFQTTTNDELTDQTRKLNEIRRMLQTISMNKPKQDLALNEMLDVELQANIDMILEEIKFFQESSESIAPSPEFEIFQANLEKFNELDDAQKQIVRTMINVGHQEATLLYYIYVTLPAMVISTGVVVNTETATSDSMTDPAVAKQLRETIVSSLSSLPKLSEKLDEAMKKLLRLTSAFSGSEALKRETIVALDEAFRSYYRLVDMKVKAYKNQISLQKANARTVAEDAGTTVAGTKDVISQKETVSSTIDLLMNFIGLFIETAGVVKEKMNEVSNEYQQMPDLIKLTTSVDTAIQAMTLTKTSIGYSSTVGVPDTPKNEGFASEKNPYNAPSPNTKQAFDFRLEKRGLVKDVLSTSRI